MFFAVRGEKKKMNFRLHRDRRDSRHQSPRSGHFDVSQYMSTINISLNAVFPYLPDNHDRAHSQHQETVPGSGSHLGGGVTQTRTEVKNNNSSENVLTRRILDYGLVKSEGSINLVW